MSNSPPTAVSIDLWGTVLTIGDRVAAQAWRTAEFIRVLTAFGHPVDDPDHLQSVIRRTLDFHARQQRHHGIQSTVDTQIADILREIGTAGATDLLHVLTTVHINARLRACPEPIHGITRALDRLRAAGHRIVLSCNTLTCPGTITRDILEEYDLTQRFDTLLFSDEIGIAKPHSDFFQRVIDAAGTPARQILHAGDDWYTDIVGATHAGLTTAWFNPLGKHHPPALGPTMEYRDPSCLPALAGCATIDDRLAS